MHRIPLSPLRAALLFGLSALTIVGCDDDDDDGGGGPNPDVVLAKATPSGDAQTGTVGADLAEQLRVVVTEDGSPAQGVDVTFATTNGSVTPTTATTDVDGIAAAVWTLGEEAGSQEATASLTDATGSPQTFTATAEADVAANLVTVSGADQAGVISAAAPAPLILRVTDQFGNGVAGTAVNFAVTAGDATAAPGNANTTATGEAQTTITFGPAAGAATVEATSTGLTGSPQTFTFQSGHVVVSNDLFTPNAVTVDAGTTVRWVWAVGGIGHNITPVGGTEPTATASPSNSYPFVYEHTFNTPGVYNYQCTNHPATMQGTITVN
jgi:plastocyanin